MEIRMEARERLLSLDFIEGLAIRISELGLSRLGTTRWLADEIYCFPGTIIDWDGNVLDMGEFGPDYIEDAYGNDASCSWNSEVKAFAVNPPRRRPRQSMLLRLGLWDVALRLNGTPVLP